MSEAERVIFKKWVSSGDGNLRLLRRNSKNGIRL
jgi:hypothetical protein